MASPSVRLHIPLPKSYRVDPIIDPREADQDALHFPRETYPLLTEFREKVLNYVYLRTRDLADGALHSPFVEVSNEDEKPVLDLSLVIDRDWESIQALQQEVLTWLSKWAAEWSDEEQEDYRDHIFFSMMPREL